MGTRRNARVRFLWRGSCKGLALTPGSTALGCSLCIWWHCRAFHGPGGRKVLKKGGGGGWDPHFCVRKMAQEDFPCRKFRCFPRWSLWSWGGGGVPPSPPPVHGHSNTSMGPGGHCRGAKRSLDRQRFGHGQCFGSWGLLGSDRVPGVGTSTRCCTAPSLFRFARSAPVEPRTPCPCETGVRDANAHVYRGWSGWSRAHAARGRCNTKPFRLRPQPANGLPRGMWRPPFTERDIRFRNWDSGLAEGNRAVRALRRRVQATGPAHASWYILQASVCKMRDGRSDECCAAGRRWCAPLGMQRTFCCGAVLRLNSTAKMRAACADVEQTPVTRHGVSERSGVARPCAPAAPAFPRPPSPSQFTACSTGRQMFHWLVGLLPFRSDLGKRRGLHVPSRGGGGGTRNG